MLAANGEVITHFYEQNRAPVAGDQIAGIMRKAMVAIEDARFYEHGGVDVQGTARALVRNVAAGEVQEGGSTLTQQLVKQTLLQSADSNEGRNAATEQTLGRKIREARLALALEDTYSKDEILTRYLNIVYFGLNAYGIQPAARAFFGVDASALTLTQAALLAGIVQSPRDDNPFVNPEAATIRRNQVLDRMAEQGYITPAQEVEAAAAPLGLAPAPAPRRGCAEASVGAYVCDFVQKYVTQRLEISQQELEHGGYVIQTTLDPELQRAGDSAVVNTLALGDTRAATFTAVQPGTGHLLAMSVNRIFGYDPNDPTQESFNLNEAANRGAGSTYKVFVAAAALARGYSTEYTLPRAEPLRLPRVRGGRRGREVRRPQRRQLPVDPGPDDGALPVVQHLLPRARGRPRQRRGAGAHGRGDGPVPVRRAGAGGQDDRRGPRLVHLRPRGDEPAGPRQRLLHAGGRRHAVRRRPGDGGPRPVREAAAGRGREAAGRATRCTPEAIPPGVANTLNQMLRKDVEPGYSGQTGRAAYVPGHQIAGKTGTTQNNLSVAFVGYTPEITASVMVFNPKDPEDVGGFGGGKGATIWHDAMAPILDARGSSDFPPADPAVERGNTKPVPGCDSMDDCAEALADAGFQSVTVRVDSDRRKGALVGTSPPRGGRAVPGQVVTILISNGSDYVEPAPEPPAPPPAPAPLPPPPVPRIRRTTPGRSAGPDVARSPRLPVGGRRRPAGLPDVPACPRG